MVWITQRSIGEPKMGSHWDQRWGSCRTSNVEAARREFESCRQVNDATLGIRSCGHIHNDVACDPRVANLFTVVQLFVHVRTVKVDKVEDLVTAYRHPTFSVSLRRVRDVFL
ncbi:hypothetical protein K437DRAFT_123923 [Tilletiaria anomala UBC 951]|uniref:Uncharacterized protein n=1 Tax=Tilletiaria anomala (strain ATCC 24038 / CBS 436.72 / UBC 951) TaxID=1037660 RepID=A0A066VU25_TILAU|nr:uncharacterized protein K437DRAFT_123923 [Tilletiaria anomala UBC 951]KDN45227.1 hypothetical protein K437DRAFT_123923 [Tilletiaria anomala UBC 951]